MRLEPESLSRTCGMSASFFVLFPGRTGSTHLCDLLDSHPQISCKYEAFAMLRSESGLQRQIRTADAAIARLQQIYAEAVPACGFKFKFPLQLEHYPEISEWLLERTATVRCIYLSRDNLLKTEVSRQNRGRLAKLKAQLGMRARDTLEAGPLTLDIDEALSHMRQLKRNVERYRALSLRFDHQIEVRYEELLADEAAVLRRLTTFLGVDPSAPLQSRAQKVTQDDLRLALANYDEVCNQLRNTEFAVHLPD